MSHETQQKLDDISQSILKLRDVGDNIFDELHAKISKLLALVELQKKLDELARAIREGTVLPVRRINYNIKKLSEDDEAIKAGVTLPWSSGPVEGHINRLKMLKRQMFGRARLDLLSRRFLLAPRDRRARGPSPQARPDAHAQAAAA